MVLEAGDTRTHTLEHPRPLETKMRASSVQSHSERPGSFEGEEEDDGTCLAGVSDGNNSDDSGGVVVQGVRKSATSMEGIEKCIGSQAYLSPKRPNDDGYVDRRPGTPPAQILPLKHDYQTPPPAPKKAYPSKNRRRKVSDSTHFTLIFSFLLRCADQPTTDIAIRVAFPVCSRRSSSLREWPEC